MRMARQHRKEFKNVENTGFSALSNAEGARITNRDGSPNLRKDGLPFWERISLYHTLLRMPRGKFLLLVFLFYTVINVFFAVVYCLVGVQFLDGVGKTNALMKQFEVAFFFSSQTLTTVGYGHISPVGTVTNAIASLESFIGILSFALVTGLFYARFSRPKAYLLFSDNILVAPYKGGKALMIRFTSYKNNHLTDVEALWTVALHVQEGDKRVTRFYQLPLEINKVASLALSWTMVHALDENSPLYSYSVEELMDNKVEVIVAIKGFDDHFSNTVQQRTSFTHRELVYGAKFIPMYERSEDGSHTVLELDKVGAYERVPLPEPDAELQEIGALRANT